jgi:hypothetical protein
MRSMETKEIILQELRDISEIVANIPKGNTFSLPAGYFDQFPAAVLAQIHAENVDFGVKNTPFDVPKGYFDDLAGNILNKIKEQQVQTVEEELNEIAPILNTISRKPVYAVPDGYFESLEVTVPLKVAKPAAKVFSFGKPKRMLQYAVAACTAGILMVGAYLYINKGTATPGQEMAISYDSAMKMNVSEELSDLNTQEIDQYLEESPAVGYAINTTADEMDVQQYIHSASDEEIDQYLNETADPGEKRNGS